MIDAGLTRRDSWLHRRDPRSRVACAAIISVAVLAMDSYLYLSVFVALAIAIAFSAGAVSPSTIRRFAGLNVFMGVLVLLMPLMEPGDPLFSLGGWPYSREGLQEAIRVAVKGNAILMWITVLLATLDPVSLGHALEQLGVSAKLTRLLLFTVRYMAVLGVEYAQLRRAMRLRAFRPSLSRHTFRTLGYLVGMLLVRALDRSERITNAMKCRGFNGHFRPVRPYTMRRADWLFTTTIIAVTGTLLWADWT
ncbi:MAG: hypothetical protein AMXMBFR84_10360 [Candidatus Hydrogenedentota bacterium]